MPNVDHMANEHNITASKVILQDAFIHSGPLILFLVLFRLISKNTVKDKPFVLFKKINIKGYHKTAFITLAVILSYLIHIRFEEIYMYDYFTLVILALCTFVTSYQIYSSILE